MTGTIKKVIADRGFGFITGQDGRDVFFHRSVLQGVAFESLRQGQTVEFDVEQGPKGPRATNVRVAGEPRQ